MRKHDWPNGLGFDIRTHAGEWEILTPATAAQPFRARFIPHGARFPSLYGEGSTAEAAMMGAEQVSQDEPDGPPCPGCGCVPGDGRTAGCTDPDGCGYFTAEGARVLSVPPLDDPDGPPCPCVPGAGQTDGCKYTDGCGYYVPQCYACERVATGAEDAAAFVRGVVEESDPETGPRASDLVEVLYCAACAPRRAEAPCPACGGIGMGHTCCPPPAAS